MDNDGHEDVDHVVIEYGALRRCVDRSITSAMGMGLQGLGEKSVYVITLVYIIYPPALVIVSYIIHYGLLRVGM